MVDSSRKVVARYADTRVFKGYTDDFQPDRPRFHVFSSAADRTEAKEIAVRDLKAVFFVRALAGDPQYNERKGFMESEQPSGRKVEVTFLDGEVLVGSTTTGYSPDSAGFFFSPADPRSNNLRVFAVADSVRTVRYL